MTISLPGFQSPPFSDHSPWCIPSRPLHGRPLRLDGAVFEVISSCLPQKTCRIFFFSFFSDAYCLGWFKTFSVTFFLIFKWEWYHLSFKLNFQPQNVYRKKHDKNTNQPKGNLKPLSFHRSLTGQIAAGRKSIPTNEAELIGFFLERERNGMEGKQMGWVQR